VVPNLMGELLSGAVQIIVGGFKELRGFLRVLGE
jgi:hypothetical protein